MTPAPTVTCAGGGVDGADRVEAPQVDDDLAGLRAPTHRRARCCRPAAPARPGGARAARTRATTSSTSTGPKDRRAARPASVRSSRRRGGRTTSGSVTTRSEPSRLLGLRQEPSRLTSGDARVDPPPSVRCLVRCRMVAIPDSARAVLEGPNLAHVVTIDPDGSPQVSCVWVGLDGDEVVFASLGPWRKLRNLERDPRIALSVESPELNHHGDARVPRAPGHRHGSRRAARPSCSRSWPTCTSAPTCGSRRWTIRPRARSCGSRSTASAASAPGPTERA